MAEGEGASMGGPVMATEAALAGTGGSGSARLGASAAELRVGRLRPVDDVAHAEAHRLADEAFRVRCGEVDAALRATLACQVLGAVLAIDGARQWIDDPRALAGLERAIETLEEAVQSLRDILTASVSGRRW